MNAADVASLSLLLVNLLSAAPATSPGDSVASLAATVDPLTRYVHITYRMPPDAGDEALVACAWSPAGKNDWRAARVTPLISDTALALLTRDEWQPWIERGEIIERRAAGLERTVVFHPYPDAEIGGRVAVDFRIQIRSRKEEVLAKRQTRVRADNSDVVYVEDWSRVYQKADVLSEPEPKGQKWSWRTGLPTSMPVSMGNGLWGKSEPDVPLPQLSYPLDLRGWYAIFVATTPGEGGQLRLSGDERGDVLVSPHAREEIFWRWAKMDRQNLVFRQMHYYTGWSDAHIDYVKLVPLSKELLDRLEARYGGEPDKFIAGYFEPYSWAFVEKVQETLQHREPLIPFRDCRINLVDIQIGRFCDKVVYESRLTDRLLYETFGDPIGNVAMPRTNNAGRMQQFTNTLDAELRYARELGLKAHANFGAGACYVGTLLQGDISKQHSDWLRDGHHLRYELPQVRAYALSLCREALDIGARGLSVDFCRYPEVIDSVETCNTFLRELRNLADEAGESRRERVTILVRFPGTNVRRWQLFDFTTWARQGWVDYLCPSNLQARHLHIDIAPYLEAVRGTKCMLLPCIDGLSWALEMPGPFLWRVNQLYDAGVPGLYIYQADNRVMSRRPEDRRCMRMLAGSEAVRRWWQEDKTLRPKRSKNIYITPPSELGVYHQWERLRAWFDGIEMGEAEFHLDDQLVNRSAGPPYLLGTEEYASDQVIPPGEHKLKIRAKDGDGWLEKTFTIQGAK